MDARIWTTTDVVFFIAQNAATHLGLCALHARDLKVNQDARWSDNKGNDPKMAKRVRFVHLRAYYVCFEVVSMWLWR